MSFELGLFLFIALVGCGVCGWLARSLAPPPLASALLAVIACLWAGLGWLTVTTESRATQAIVQSGTPVALPADGYVSSDECQACHPGHYASWHKTYHRTMTQRPGPDSVRGDFSGQAFEFESVRFRPYAENGRYFVSVTDLRVPEAQRETVTHEIALLSGSHNYQVYWHETDHPRELGQVPIVYFITDQRWLPRQAAFIQPQREILGDGETGRWNSQCILCHAVNGREVRGDSAQQPTDTRVSEFGIACESCHGPAAAHVRKYRNPLGRYLAHWDLADGGDMVNPRQLGAEQSVHLCGQCHSVQHFPDDWWQGAATLRPGEPLETNRHVIWGDPEHWNASSWPVLRAYYWRDGQARVRGREFHDVLRSPCFESGDYSCLTCHALHKEPADTRTDDTWRDKLLRAGAADGDACLDCHPALKDAAARTVHTRHPSDSSGSACLNCHMPNTAFGFLRGMRSHRISVPDAWDSLSTGRPLACNQCHLDQTLQWSAEHLRDWTGREMPELPELHRRLAASLVWMWSGDAGQRALMAWSARWQPARDVSGQDWLTPHLWALLDDDYPGVRQVALRSLEIRGDLPETAIRVFGNEAQRREDLAGRAAQMEGRARATLSAARRERLLLTGDGALDSAGVAQLKTLRDPSPMMLRE